MNYFTKETMIENKNFLYFNIVIPIVLACIIKLSRQTNFFFFPKSSIISNFIKYNLIDGFWLYSFSCLMILIWDKKISKSSLLWLFPFLLICLIHEFLQKTHILGGTFDYLDIITYVVAFLTAISLNLNFKSIK